MTAVKVKAAAAVMPLTAERVALCLKHEVSALVEARPDHLHLTTVIKEERTVGNVVTRACLKLADRRVVRCSEEHKGLTDGAQKIG